MDNTSQLTGYVTQDIVIATTTDWVEAWLIVMLDQPGGIYQDPMGSANPQSPDPASLAGAPSLEFDTYVSSGVLGESVSITGAAGLGGSAEVIFDQDNMSIAWSTADTNDIGELAVARMTLADTASGTWHFLATGTAVGRSDVPEIRITGAVENGVLVKLDEDPFRLEVSKTTVWAVEGGSSQFTVALSQPPIYPVTVTTTRTSGDEDLTVVSGAELLFDDTNWDVPQAVTIAASEDADASDGLAEFSVSAVGTPSTTVRVVEADNDDPGVTMELVRVDSTSQLTGYVTQDIVIATATDWLGAQLVVTLAEPGSIYQDSMGSANPQSPNPAFFGAFPTLEFDTYVGNGVLGESVSTTGAVDLGGPATAIFDQDHISITWYTADVDDIGELALARVTLTDTASGTWQFLASASPAEGPKVLTGGAVENGLLRETLLDVSQTHLTADEGGTSEFAVALMRPPINPVTVTTTRTSGDEDLTVVSGAALVFDFNNWDVPQTVTVAAAEDADANDGQAVFTVSAPGAADTTVTATELDNDKPGVTMELVPVDSTSQLTGYVTQDIVIATTTDWANAELIVTLDQAGGIYQDPSGSAHPQSPDPALFSSAPSLEFDTYVSSGVLGEPVFVTGATSVGGSESAIFDQGSVSIAWSTADTDDIGELILARVTLADTAAGTWRFLATATVAGESDLPEIQITGAVENGVLVKLYEHPFELVVSDTDLAVPEGGTAELEVAFLQPLFSTVTVTTTRTGGDEDLTVVSGGALVFDAANWDVPQPVTIAASEDGDTSSPQAEFTLATPGAPATIVTVTKANNDQPGIGLALVPVDNTSELIGYVTQDIVITTTTDWLGAQLVVTLDQPGGIYQDPMGSANPQSPAPAFFGAFSSLEFDTYVSNGVLGESVSTTGAVDLGGPANAIFDENHISIAWYASDIDDVGELALARVTLADTATGTWQFLATAYPAEGPKVLTAGAIEDGVLLETSFLISGSELMAAEADTGDFAWPESA